MESDLIDLEPHIREEAAKAMQTGAYYAMMLGAVSALLIIPGLMWSGAAQGLEAPWIVTVMATVSCLVMHRLARTRRLCGWRAWVFFSGFVSLPTLLFVLSELMEPAGAASFLVGPFSYLYLFLIATSGFVFDARLSGTMGVVAAVGYQLSWFLARDHLALVEAHDPLLAQDIQGGAIYATKGVMMIFTGLTVGALAVIARRLILRVMREAQEKEQVSRTFGEFVSPTVAQRLLSDPHARDGERKEVVVLFSDIRSFTSYSETANPEALVERLNLYFEEMVAAINAEGGVVDKFIGDAVMAVFGGVLPLDNPSASAVRAARGMRARLAALNARWAGAGEPPFDNGIGLHLGEVLQGAIGSSHRRDYTVIGDAVNTASRVEGLTKDHGVILVTAAVKSALPDELAGLCTPLGAIPVKGRAAEVEVFSVAEFEP